MINLHELFEAWARQEGVDPVVAVKPDELRWYADINVQVMYQAYAAGYAEGEK